MLKFLLFIIATVLYAVLAIPSILYSVIFRLRGFGDYFYRMAVSVDQLGNVTCGPLLDTILIKSYSMYKFGDPDETISSVLGRNKKAGTLTRLGLGLSWVLHKIDAKHVTKSIGG